MNAKKIAARKIGSGPGVGVEKRGGVGVGVPTREDAGVGVSSTTVDDTASVGISTGEATHCRSANVSIGVT